MSLGCGIQLDPYQVSLWLHAGITGVPSPRGPGFLCANDAAYGGDCKGDKKVQIKGQYCDHCIVSCFPV